MDSAAYIQLDTTNASPYHPPVVDNNIEARKYAREALIPSLLPAIEALLEEVKDNGHLAYWLSRKHTERSARRSLTQKKPSLKRPSDGRLDAASVARRSSNRGHGSMLGLPDSPHHHSVMSSVDDGGKTVVDGEERRPVDAFDPLVWIANYLKGSRSQHHHHDDDYEHVTSNTSQHYDGNHVNSVLGSQCVDDADVVVQGGNVELKEEDEVYYMHPMQGQQHQQHQQHQQQSAPSTLFMARAATTGPTTSPMPSSSVRPNSSPLGHSRPPQKQLPAFRWSADLHLPPTTPTRWRPPGPDIGSNGILWRLDVEPQRHTSSASSPCRSNDNTTHHRQDAQRGMNGRGDGRGSTVVTKLGRDTVNNNNNSIPLKRRRSHTTVAASASDKAASSRKVPRPAPINLVQSTRFGAQGLRGGPPLPTRSSSSSLHQHRRHHTGSSQTKYGIDRCSSKSFAPRYAPKGHLADKRINSSHASVHTKECPVKHKWVDDGSDDTNHRQRSSNTGDECSSHEGSFKHHRRNGRGDNDDQCRCPVCAALLEPHATRARENNLKLLTTALDVPPDARTISLRYGCRYGHKFTQIQNVSAPYDMPLSCPQCRLAKAPPPLRSGLFRGKVGSTTTSSTCRGKASSMDPMAGLTPRERQAAALKAAKMEYQASLHKGVSPSYQTLEATAKINQLVTRLKSKVPSTREQVVLGIVECPDELGLWPLLRSLLDMQPQPGQTEVDKDKLYRRAALLCHPDKCDHDRAKEAFAKLSAEYAASNNAGNAVRTTVVTGPPSATTGPRR